MVDLSGERGERVMQRLRDEAVIWLTTVRADGTPEPSPVWFLWDGATFLIYSEPDKPKINNIRANERVALNFDSDGKGGNIVIFNGTAYVEDGPISTDQIAAYVQKYRQGMAGIGMTSERFAEVYSAAIRVTPMKLRGF